MGNYNPLDFSKWEQVVALALVIGGALLWYYLNKMAGNLNKNTKATENIKKTLTETNSGSHVKDQLNRIEETIRELSAKVVETSTIIAESKDTFKYMRDNFKDKHYFEKAESRHDSHESRLKVIERFLKQQKRGTFFNRKDDNAD